MYRSAIILGLYLSFAIAIGASCSPPAPLETPPDEVGDDDSATPKGGASNGGSIGTNGGSNPGQGGTMVANGGTGGTLPMNGGASGSAGRAAGGASSGGVTGGSGRAATGGAAGTVSAMGGTGNTMTTGGATGMAGTTSGSAGTGSSTVSCDTTFAVSAAGLVRAPMKGGACWHGYASAGAGDGTLPDAGTPSTGSPTSFEMCGEGCMLKVSGTLAAADESYAYLGFNVNEAGGTTGTIKPTGTGVKVTFTKTGTFDVRVQISAGSKRWCATATSGTTIPWTMLKTECWGTTGTAYNMEAIDQIQLSVPGKAASATPYALTLTSVEES